MTTRKLDSKQQEPVMNKDKWKERLAWCHFFGEVVDIFDEAGCPPAENVGAAHLCWAKEPGGHELDTHPGYALAFVTLGGFQSRQVSIRFQRERWVRPKNLDELKVEAAHLAVLIKEHRGR